MTSKPSSLNLPPEMVREMLDRQLRPVGMLFQYPHHHPGPDPVFEFEGGDHHEEGQALDISLGGMSTYTVVPERDSPAMEEARLVVEQMREQMNRLEVAAFGNSLLQAGTWRTASSINAERQRQIYSFWDLEALREAAPYRPSSTPDDRPPALAPPSSKLPSYRPR